MTRRVVEAVLITVLGSAAVQAQSLRVATYLTGLDQPVGLVADPSDDHRQFVVEKAGRVRLVIDAVLQPGPVHGGMATDPGAELQRLLDRLVG